MLLILRLHTCTSESLEAYIVMRLHYDYTTLKNVLRGLHTISIPGLILDNSWCIVSFLFVSMIEYIKAHNNNNTNILTQFTYICMKTFQLKIKYAKWNITRLPGLGHTSNF